MDSTRTLAIAITLDYDDFQIHPFAIDQLQRRLMRAVELDLPMHVRLAMQGDTEENKDGFTYDRTPARKG